MEVETTTPVLLLGGRENTLSATRNFSRMGVSVTICAADGCQALYSRFCKRKFKVPKNTSVHDYWRELLLGDNENDLNGHIIFPFCDDSLEFLETHHQELRKRYILEEFVPELRKSMLDKQDTLRLARTADIPIPNYWPINSDEEVLSLRDEVRFPVMVKPLLSHAFVAEFGTKLFIIENDFDEVVEKTNLARSHGHDVMIVEMIPGPDDLLVSYYTFMDKSGRHLFDYTKRVLRRWPVNRGGGCYHISDWDSEVAELGKKFFDFIGWQGIANIEFKRDVRDGQLKVIEVNSRFTAAHRLVVASGAEIDKIIYCHLTKQPVPSFDTYASGMRYWYPLRDFLAFVELNRSGQLSFFNWLRSVVGKKKILPYFSFTDPIPAVRESIAEFARITSRLLNLRRKPK